MICRATYRDMVAGRTPLPPPRGAGSVSGLGAADRLEAAIDACMADNAAKGLASSRRTRAMERASPIPPDMRPLMDRLRMIRPTVACVFSRRLSWMRGWLGDRWTKRTVAELFLAGVSRRYEVDGGWGRCDVGCGPPSAGMTFKFGLAPRREALALAELGDILGVGRPPRMDRESAAGYLEDLRMAARLMRFDLEATRREAGGARREGGFPDDGYVDDDDDGDDGYYPPFEGSPGDGSF